MTQNLLTLAALMMNIMLVYIVMWHLTHRWINLPPYIIWSLLIAVGFRIPIMIYQLIFIWGVDITPSRFTDLISLGATASLLAVASSHIYFYYRQAEK